MSDIVSAGRAAYRSVLIGAKPPNKPTAEHFTSRRLVRCGVKNITELIQAYLMAISTRVRSRSEEGHWSWLQMASLSVLLHNTSFFKAESLQQRWPFFLCKLRSSCSETISHERVHKSGLFNSWVSYAHPLVAQAKPKHEQSPCLAVNTRLFLRISKVSTGTQA